MHALSILGTPPEASFDRFVSAAASSFDAPLALLSLIHADQQWFKACHGVDVACHPRNRSFCNFALDRPDTLEVCDPCGDSRFASLPAVTGAPHIRYYIGVPLRVRSGIDVGALCVLDTRERKPASADQKAYILALGRQAATALEARADLLRIGGIA